MRALGASPRKKLCARAEFLQLGYNYKGRRDFFPNLNAQPESPSLEADVAIIEPSIPLFHDVFRNKAIS
jgi:hypothetical protein